MFETIFTNAATIRRYQQAPLAQERSRYLEHCASVGMTHSMLIKVARDQVRLVHLLDLPTDGFIDISHIRKAVERWLPSEGHPSDDASLTKRHQRIINGSARWLRHAGLMSEPDAPSRHSHVHAEQVRTFTIWMRRDRGFSEGTIRVRCRVADQFCHRLDDESIPLSEVGIGLIDAQVASWKAGGLCRMTIRNYAVSLRIFIRYAESRGWCRAGLADGILAPGFQPDETVPRGFAREEVRSLIASVDGNRPIDLRDRAILLLLATHGLRAGEVAGLTLEDIDWQQERIRVRCPKPGRMHHLPLSPVVGNAILLYIREARPATAERALFFTVWAPIRPITGGAIGMIVRRRSRDIGIDGPCRGSHALRHGLAQHLLDQGFSLKEVGDCLGHRSLSSTAVYARIRMNTLREIGEFDLEGLL